MAAYHTKERERYWFAGVPEYSFTQRTEKNAEEIQKTMKTPKKINYVFPPRSLILCVKPYS